MKESFLNFLEEKGTLEKVPLSRGSGTTQVEHNAGNCEEQKARLWQFFSCFVWGGFGDVKKKIKKFLQLELFSWEAFFVIAFLSRK